jgi:protease IV
MIHTLLGSKWALETAFHNRMADIIIRRIADGKEPLWGFSERKPMSFYHPESGLETNGYGRLEKPLTQSGHVAIIPIIGAMSRYGDMCSYGSEDMTNWINKANQDPNVSAIVLEINSPGGEVDGTEALGMAVKNSKKPVVAWVAGMAASAAYWVGSQAQEIWLESETSTEVGSIGVLAMHIDQSAALEAEGYKVTIIRSDGSEDKALFNSVEGLSADVLASTKESLNTIRAQFVKTVKAGRAGVADDVFSGKMYDGKTAKKKKMSDRFGSLTDAVIRADQLARRTNSSSNQNNANMEIKAKLASFFGITANDLTDAQIKEIEQSSDSAKELATLKTDKSAVDEQVVILTKERDKAQGSLGAYEALGTVEALTTAQSNLAGYVALGSAEEFKTALGWYETHKNQGGLGAGDASDQGKGKKVSAATKSAQEAYDKALAFKNQGQKP